MLRSSQAQAGVASRELHRVTDCWHGCGLSTFREASPFPLRHPPPQPFCPIRLGLQKGRQTPEVGGNLSSLGTSCRHSVPQFPLCGWECLRGLNNLQCLGKGCSPCIHHYHAQYLGLDAGFSRLQSAPCKGGIALPRLLSVPRAPDHKGQHQGCGRWALCQVHTSPGRAKRKWWGRRAGRYLQPAQ